MASDRITVRIPGSLSKRLRKTTALNGKSESQVIREALEQYLGAGSAERSTYNMAEEAELIGCVRRAPRDLSTTGSYLEGFGQKQ